MLKTEVTATDLASQPGGIARETSNESDTNRGEGGVEEGGARTSNHGGLGQRMGLTQAQNGESSSLRHSYGPLTGAFGGARGRGGRERRDPLYGGSGPVFTNPYFFVQRSLVP